MMLQYQISKENVSLLLMIITLQVVYLMSDFNKKLSTLAAKAELKAEQDDLIQVIFIGIFFFFWW